MFQYTNFTIHKVDRKSKFLFGLFTVCAIVFVANSHFNASANTSEEKVKSHTPAAVTLVKRENLSKQLEVAAQFQPYQEVNVHARVAGYVKEINVDIGDKVSLEQVLATLDVPELLEEVAEAKAMVKRYRSEIIHVQEKIHRYGALSRQAELTSQRLSSVNLTSPNLIAQQEVDVAAFQAQASAAQVASEKANLDMARQKLAEAQANERRVQDLLDFSRITAPFSGVITKRYVDVGTMVQKGTTSHTQSMPIVQIAEVNQLRLVFPVPESAMVHVVPGTPLSVKIPAIGRTFDTKVWRSSTKADDATRTMETQVLIDNPRFELKPGMLATVQLTLEQRDHVLTVPIGAVIGSKANPSVWVVSRDNKVEERKIKLGLETSTKYEVISGLSEKEEVVVAGRDKLRVGVSVTPKVIELNQPEHQAI